MRVKCFAQEHNTMTRPELKPGPLDPESSALTTLNSETRLIFGKSSYPVVVAISDSIRCYSLVFHLKQDLKAAVLKM